MNVRTASGSRYVFDNDALTWERVNTRPGHEAIRYFDGGNSGRLAAPVEPRLGERLTFFTHDHDSITTTRVTEIEP